MATRCQICGRGSTKDATRSHSNIKTTKRQHINLQTKTINGIKMQACSTCLRTLKKQKSG